MSEEINSSESLKNPQMLADILVSPTEPKETDAAAENDGDKKRLHPLLKAAFFIGTGLSVFSIVIRLCLSNNPGAAEVFYRYFTRYLQAAMAALTSFIPFSLAETLLVLLPLTAVSVIIFSVKHYIKKDVYRLLRTLAVIAAAASFIFTNYILNLSVLYCRPSLSQLSGISNIPASDEEVCIAATAATFKLRELTDSGKIVFSDSGFSVCPYTFQELDKRIEKAFDDYAKKNAWMSPYGARSKIISLSKAMTYTHISGIYTQYTGEANININYPEYVVCATMAHEKSHQRGIAPENEANLTAFFVLAESGDPYLEYCGYMSVFSEIMNACYSASSGFYVNSLLPYVPECVVREMAAYAEFFRPYSDSAAATAASAVNDAYLKSNGESDGVKSYGMVTDMAVSYLVMKFLGIE